MGVITGQRTVEIAAPVVVCFRIAADIERAPEWQGSLRNVDVLDRHADGLARTVETVSDAKVKTVRSRLRFDYDPHDAITWVQEKGDTRSLRGWWRFEALRDGMTRATYGLEIDPGGVLGMLARGPAQERIRDSLVGGAAYGLKRMAEAA